MRRILFAALAIAPLAACVQTPDAAAPSAQKTASNAGTGSAFVAGLGTPVYVLFKVPLCGFSLTAGMLLGGMSELNGFDDPGGREMRRALGSGIADNCTF